MPPKSPPGSISSFPASRGGQRHVYDQERQYLLRLPIEMRDRILKLLIPDDINIAIALKRQTMGDGSVIITATATLKQLISMKDREWMQSEDDKHLEINPAHDCFPCFEHQVERGKYLLRQIHDFDSTEEESNAVKDSNNLPADEEALRLYSLVSIQRTCKQLRHEATAIFWHFTSVEVVLSFNYTKDGKPPIGLLHVESSTVGFPVEELLEKPLLGGRIGQTQNLVLRMDSPNGQLDLVWPLRSLLPKDIWLLQLASISNLWGFAGGEDDDMVATLGLILNHVPGLKRVTLLFETGNFHLPLRHRGYQSLLLDALKGMKSLHRVSLIGLPPGADEEWWGEALNIPGRIEIKMWTLNPCLVAFLEHMQEERKRERIANNEEHNGVA